MANKKACEAYYKNIYHTAYRYLSKPNYWMSEKALYVNISEDGKEKWSTFEEYKTIICMFYLAAKDSNYPAIDGHTLESRVENFIRELALIGRAHNWDQVRFNSLGSEEYDDLEGDKPSCFSGVKRRLFHSVLGHSLFKCLLTFDDIREELRSFMREHFADKITKDNIDILKKMWLKMCVTGETPELFFELNVSLEKQKQFIQDLEYKYKDKFSGDPRFIKYIQDSFLVNERCSCHLERFAGLVNFEHLLAIQARDLSLRNFS